MKTIVTILTIVLFVLPVWTGYSIGEPIIINHSSIDEFSGLDDKVLEKIKNSFRIHYAHTSHGEQLTTGLMRVAANPPGNNSAPVNFDVAIGNSTLPVNSNHLNIFEGQETINRVGPSGYWDGAEGINMTTSTLTNNPTLNISMFAWCYQLGEYNESRVQQYLDQMASFEAAFPNVRFVYFTGHAQNDGWDGWLRSRNNKIIRDWVNNSSNRILFDFADLDSWWYDSKNNKWDLNTFERNGETHLLEHSQFIGEDGDDSGHTTYESCDQKAKALWVLLSKLLPGSVNSAPVITQVEPQAVLSGSTLTIPVEAGDADGDVLSCEVSGLPAGATFSLTENFFTWEPGEQDIGVHHLTFTVTDNGDPPLSVSMTVAVTVSGNNNNVCLNIPVLKSPVSGGIVNSQQPELTVSADNNLNEAVKVEFEIYSDKHMSSLVESKADVPVVDGIATYIVSSATYDKATYYWRARAVSESSAGEWMDTCLFKIDYSSEPTTLSELVKAEVFADSVNIQKLEIISGNPAYYGTYVEVPPDALSKDATISISEVQNGPALPADLKGIERVFEFSPSGNIFTKNVQIAMPFSDDDLIRLNCHADDLRCYTYNPSSSEWEVVQQFTADKENRLIICSTPHFSMYTLAAEESTAIDNPPSSDEDPGDTKPIDINVSLGGEADVTGCFISSMQSLTFSPELLRVIAVSVALIFILLIRKLIIKLNDQSR